jgi:chemotaxis protein methyltransferase CheR
MDNAPALDKELAYDQLLQTMQQQFGFDFTAYARPALMRRLSRALEMYHMPSLAHLNSHLLEQPSFFADLLGELTVGVTEFYRDPQVWQFFRTEVLPIAAKGNPRLDIWHAGCSTGEEVVAMTTVLHEEGLLEKSHQLGTDINPHCIGVASRGMYSHRKIELYQKNYQLAGGRERFADYYMVEGANVKMQSWLYRQMRFEAHNLVSEPAPGKFDIIMCRNVMIYFESYMQEELLKTFHGALKMGGYLIFGNFESLLWCANMSRFQIVNEQHNIVRKIRE